MHKILFMVALVFAFSAVAQDWKPEDGKASSDASAGGKDMNRQPRGEQKELTDEDAKQLKNDLNEIIKLRKELMKRMLDFKKKYNMIPDMGMGSESMMGNMRQPLMSPTQGKSQQSQEQNMRNKEMRSQQNIPPKPPPPENISGSEEESGELNPPPY